MSPALRIIAGLQFGNCPHEMASALRSVIDVTALACPASRLAAYVDAGLKFNDLPQAKYAALDQRATHIEIERRMGVAA